MHVPIQQLWDGALRVCISSKFPVAAYASSAQIDFEFQGPEKISISQVAGGMINEPKIHFHNILGGEMITYK